MPEINNIIMMKKGIIFKTGNKKELLNSSIISKLFDSKIEGINKNNYFYVKID